MYGTIYCLKKNDHNIIDNILLRMPNHHVVPGFMIIGYSRTVSRTPTSRQDSQTARRLNVRRPERLPHTRTVWQSILTVGPTVATTVLGTTTYTVLANVINRGNFKELYRRDRTRGNVYSRSFQLFITRQPYTTDVLIINKRVANLRWK